jgi:hypothetical protein
MMAASSSETGEVQGDERQRTTVLLGTSAKVSNSILTNQNVA